MYDLIIVCAVSILYVYIYVYYSCTGVHVCMCCCVRVYSYFKVTNKPYEAGCIGQCKYCISLY